MYVDSRRAVTNKPPTPIRAGRFLSDLRQGSTAADVNSRCKSIGIWRKSSMYERFEMLDGSHPWRNAAPDGFVDYPARVRGGGRVVYFNFDLARELELIPANHA